MLAPIGGKHELDQKSILEVWKKPQSERSVQEYAILKRQGYLVKKGAEKTAVNFANSFLLGEGKTRLPKPSESTSEFVAKHNVCYESQSMVVLCNPKGNSAGAVMITPPGSNQAKKLKKLADNYCIILTALAKFQIVPPEQGTDDFLKGLAARSIDPILESDSSCVSDIQLEAPPAVPAVPAAPQNSGQQTTEAYFRDNVAKWKNAEKNYRSLMNAVAKLKETNQSPVAFEWIFQTLKSGPGTVELTLSIPENSTGEDLGYYEAGWKKKDRNYYAFQVWVTYSSDSRMNFYSIQDFFSYSKNPEPRYDVDPEEALFYLFYITDMENKSLFVTNEALEETDEKYDQAFFESFGFQMTTVADGSMMLNKLSCSTITSKSVYKIMTKDDVGKTVSPKHVKQLYNKVASTSGRMACINSYDGFTRKMLSDAAKDIIKHINDNKGGLAVPFTKPIPHPSDPCFDSHLDQYWIYTFDRGDNGKFKTLLYDPPPRCVTKKDALHVRLKENEKVLHFEYDNNRKKYIVKSFNQIIDSDSDDDITDLGESNTDAVRREGEVVMETEEDTDADSGSTVRREGQEEETEEDTDADSGSTVSQEEEDEEEEAGEDMDADDEMPPWENIPEYVSEYRTIFARNNRRTMLLDDSSRLGELLNKIHLAVIALRASDVSRKEQDAFVANIWN